uniref:sugar 3,4-ketoisomerase n=1 Tax=Flavobacterium sp. TaxID=239 RepID=UPI004049494C
MTAVKLIEFPKIPDSRGNLTFLEIGEWFPFTIRRVFYSYDVPSGTIKGGHAYYKQSEIIIPLSGSFDVYFIGKTGIRGKFSLSRPNLGLFLPELTWRHIENYSTNAVSLHISDSNFNELDYITNYNLFESLIEK